MSSTGARCSSFSGNEGFIACSCSRLPISPQVLYLIHVPVSCYLRATGGGTVGRVLAAATRARLPAAIPATRAAGSAARVAKTPPATSATSSVAAGAAKKTSPTPSAAPWVGSATSSVAAGAAKKTSPTPSAAPRAGSVTSSVSAGAAKKTSPTPSAAPRAGSATPSAAARAAKTKTGPDPAAAPPAGSATPPTIPSMDPVKAVNDAISKVETPVFFPSRIANTYNEIVKLLPHAGWPAYLLEKYSEKGCSDVCPFTGNGEFSPFPVQRPAVTVQKPAVAVQVPVEVDEKHHAEEDKGDAEVGEKQPADGENACFFHEIGKKASDLLYKDYTSGLKLIADCKVLDTAVLLSGGSEQIGKPSLRFELSSDTKLIKLTIDNVLRPGLKGLLSIPISSGSSSKVDSGCV
ncbi:uncharacterized protein LOC123408922 isoform X3 [Hordeum vulgare subsp. vulgare]|uniref:uncharacterized protein LOC123408922 isoform X3 n=1 Tax=Hordeum vulgare subsp. vulgare TaxID=112509 RepID=UPI001D1A3ECC|nr:uncharacterized protein LOC123408922 isoform X3 [Hordeum vulgare subsp. vulgare]